MQSALSNQQTGSTAAANLGNVGQQGINANMNVGLEQMNAPFQTAGNQASLLGTLQAPTTVQSQKQLAPLGQVAALGNAVTGGTAGLNSLLNTLGIKGGLSGLFSGSSIGTNIPGSGQTTVPIDTSSGGYGNPVTGTGANGGAGAGQVLGTDGNVYTDPTYGTGSTSTTSTDAYTDPNSGVITSQNPSSIDYSSGV